MIIPLDKAVKFYELKDLLLEYITETADLAGDDLQDWAHDLRLAIQSIDATTDKVAAIGEEKQ